MLDLRIIKPARFSIQENQRKESKMKRVYKIKKDDVNTLEINGKTLGLSEKEKKGAYALFNHLLKGMPGCFPSKFEISWDAESQELRIPMGFEVFWKEEQASSTETGDAVITFSGTGRNPLSLLKNYKEEGNGTHSFFIDYSGVVEAIDHFAEIGLILW